MTYDELKKIASPHIRQGEKLPSNSLLLLTQLHIPYKTEKQCKKDFEGTTDPLKNTPAFLSIDSNEIKTLYFSTNTQYWNFYIFHEIAHCLLGHESNSPQNEIDADMLACILAAPIENLPSYLKSARDLSSLCQIPIDKAEMYWQEISSNFSKPYKKLLLISGILIILIIICTFFIFNRYTNTPKDKFIQSTFEESIPSTPPNNTVKNEVTYYITSSGTHYHIRDCQYIKYKTNIISVSLEDVKILMLESCKECIN